MEITVSHEISKNASEAVENAQRKRMQDAMDSGFARSQELVPQDRGTLLQSGFPPEWTRDNRIQWGYEANHALPIERGTIPFHPPIEPLVEWAERVSGDPGLGYYVANVKIPTEGIDASPFAGPGAEKTKKWLETRDFGSYLDDELD